MNYTERKVHHEENDEDWNVFCCVYVSCSSFSNNCFSSWIHIKTGKPCLLANKGINVGVGSAQYEPQSVEAPKGFPISGPADGSIAGGGKYSLLDEQSASRWAKVDIESGPLTVEWTLTAPHKTSSWQYFITKKVGTQINH